MYSHGKAKISNLLNRLIGLTPATNLVSVCVIESIAHLASIALPCSRCMLDLQHIVCIVFMVV
jgi:hypothetical protein